MEIVLSEDQTLIRDSAQRFGADHGGGDRLRRLRDGDGTGFEHQDLADAGADGWLGLMAPDPHDEDDEIELIFVRTVILERAEATQRSALSGSSGGRGGGLMGGR